MKTQSEKRKMQNNNVKLKIIPPKMGYQSFSLCALRFTSNSRRGFTLLEIIISVGILVLIGTISLVSFINSRRVRDLTTSGQNALSLLRTAQSRALAGENNDQWGVHLQADRLVLFQGTSYASATSTTTHILPTSIEVANIMLLGGGSDVIFKKLTGWTDQPGTLDVRVKAVPTQIFQVTVDTSGKVYQMGTASVPAGTRVIDARHRAFNLGWSIQNSLVLTLTFSDPPNPDIIYPVTMATYFDTGKTKFDWSGSVLVGGQAQVLRIHTTSLTGTNTILHVDRDCRYSTKRVVITIDTSSIATYEVDCATIIVGVSGGTMSEP